MQLSRFPRVPLCHRPTPLEPMENLSDFLGGPQLFVKRDDCTGLAGGGNKTRKLEFLLGDALEQGADTVITHGAVQSNHVRQTVAGAAKLGLQCKVLLEHRVAPVDTDYETTANVFLNRLYGVEPIFVPVDTDMDAACEALGREIEQAGGKPYLIPGGGSNRIGALGYVSCALELVQQANERGLVINHLVHATGSTGTQAGLVAGLEGCNSAIEVHGISVRRPRDEQENAVFELTRETAAYAGVKNAIARDSIRVDSAYVGPGYGAPTAAMVEAVELAARSEGLLLDPVYSGKAMAGLIGLVRAGFFAPTDTVVFLHTGGSVALFAYQSVFVQRES